EQVGTHTGQLWAVVNFAGLTAFCSMVEGDCVNKAESLLAVNVLGMARVNRFFFDLVQAGGGRIINCTSEAGWMAPPPFAAPYYLSKHAAEAYSDSLRRELLYLGIPVIKIQPGPYETRMTQSVEDMYRQTLANTRFYSRLLPRVKPFMDRELKKKNDPEDLARIVSKAIEAPHPRLQYRAGTSLLLRLFQLLPDRGVDAVYRILGRCG
ncbi:MAG TPA: short-chain dehydrogenase, partial [Clostridiales bacterium]|nr:short-chain dehydrogenase [Clostridiales bacterium]